MALSFPLVTIAPQPADCKTCRDIRYAEYSRTPSVIQSLEMKGQQNRSGGVDDYPAGALYANVARRGAFLPAMATITVQIEWHLYEKVIVKPMWRQFTRHR